MSATHRFRILLSVAVSVFAVVWIIHFAANSLPQFGKIAGHTTTLVSGSSALGRSLRPNYPYSIIAGGAYSAGELQFADHNDQLIRDHYADFNVKNTRLVALTDDRYQYVSYRLKNQIYWTRKKLRIPKGELLLTDGSSYARARCGNRLSDTPHAAATNPHEPDGKQLSLPAVTPQTLPTMALATPPVSGVPGPMALPATVTGAAPVTNETRPLTAAIKPATPNQDNFTGFAPVVTGFPGTLTGGGSPAGALVPVNPSHNSPGQSGAVATPPLTPGSSSTSPVTTPVVPETIPVPEPNTIYLILFIFVMGPIIASRVLRNR